MDYDKAAPRGLVLGLLLGTMIFLAAATVAFRILTIVQVAKGQFAGLLILLAAAACAMACQRAVVSYRKVSRRP